jgi:hypothetical protein
MPRGLSPAEKREYVQRQKEKKVKTPPFVGPKTGHIDYKAQPPAKPTEPQTRPLTTEERERRRRITTREQQIQKTYEEAPVVRTKVREDGRFVFKEFYKPTPKQAQRIVELAKGLPPEKRAKYIVEPSPPKEEPKGIAETLVSVRMEDVQSFIATGLADIAGLKGEKRERFLGTHAKLTSTLQPKLVTGKPMPMFGEPVQTIGGMVAPFETIVYGGERLISAGITRHEPITPRPPPTVTGGLVGTALGAPSELQKVEEYGASYVAGTILGDVVLGYLAGKGAEKVWAVSKKIPVLKKAPIFLERAKYGVVEKIVKRAPERIQKWYYGPYYKEWKMSQQLVFEKKPFAGYKEFYLTTETMLPTKPPAEQWLLKMRGTPSTPFSKTLEMAISRGGGMGGLASTQQIVVTEYAKRNPFALTHYPITEPSMHITTGGLTSMLFGFGATTGLKAFGYQPITPERAIVKQRQLPKVKKIERLAPGQAVTPFLQPLTRQEPTQILKPQQAVKVAQIQKVLQQQQLRQRTQQLQRQLQTRQQLQVPRLFAPSRPSRKRKKKKKDSMFGLYGRYPRFYPLATSEDVLKMVIG